MKERIDIFDQINSNKRKSVALAFFVGVILFSLIIVISLFFNEYSYIIVSLGVILVLVYIYAGYKGGYKVVLAATNAKPADDRKYLYLHNVVEGLSIAAGIPKPKVYVIPNEDINAFASGPDPEHSVIAITEGALKKLDRDEIEGVIGHEMSHIRNYDIRFSMLVAVLVGLVAILSNMMIRMWWYGGRSDRDRGGIQIILLVVAFLLALLSPIVTRLVQLAISRRREYLADAGSAQLTRNPDSLADALEKIAKENKNRLQVSEAISHIFFFDPKKTALDNLFATHPPVEKRIEILRRM
jgi:heat shock protein HtpX